uniref:Uncharacterized protein LOC104247255 isoform X2 n=1 Tax=Nicotiana sylvestris TaxID=4096 RepID=A0A1U7YHV9_NICSY|nr:PREDICTED: uncharacterized protein LOC104247255 isoform X2 [Nicotiana sylvestris]
MAIFLGLSQFSAKISAGNFPPLFPRISPPFIFILALTFPNSFNSLIRAFSYEVQMSSNLFFQFYGYGMKLYMSQLILVVQSHCHQGLWSRNQIFIYEGCGVNQVRLFLALRMQVSLWLCYFDSHISLMDMLK